MKVLVTGANGFVGGALLQELRSRGHEAVAATRLPTQNSLAVGELNGTTDWTTALHGCEAVVHTAARVHQMKEQAADAERLYRGTNVEGTLNLAKQAVAAGVKRFIFLSSVKAMGEAGHFSDKTPCRPEDAYGRSKRDAEEALLKLSSETSLEVVILRLPLVYGPGVKGNFRRMLDAVARGAPLPFGRVRNQRSVLYLGNLTDLVILCLTSPSAVGTPWLPSDGDALSTPDLLREVGQALGVKARLLPVPPAAIRLAARMAGRSGVADRLLGSLAVDSTTLQERLGWYPRFTLAQGLADTVRWYRSLG